MLDASKPTHAGSPGELIRANWSVLCRVLVWGLPLGFLILENNLKMAAVKNWVSSIKSSNAERAQAGQ